MIKYVLCPGYVTSNNDRQLHYVGGVDLIRLYNVNPFECIRLKSIGSMRNEFIYLVPRQDGNYKLPNK